MCNKTKFYLQKKNLKKLGYLKGGKTMVTNNGRIKSNAELRAAAREQLKGNWATAVLMCLISSLLCSLPCFIPFLAPAITMLIFAPIALGLSSCFLKLVRNQPFRLEDLFDGFKNYTSALLLQILMSIYILLWSLLLVIPGIVAAYSFSMAFYILSDNPQIGAMGALMESKKMMMGHKWKLFCLHLSFIGWAVLSILSLGIGFLWLVPYVNASVANFYQNLKDASSWGQGDYQVVSADKASV